MAKRSRKRTAVWAVLFVLAASAACVLYAQGYFDWWLGELASGAGKFNPATCGKAAFEITSVECKNKVFSIEMKNTGRVPLKGNFLAVLSTDSMQVFTANDTDAVMKPASSGRLVLSLEALEGTARKVSVVFQPCEGVVAEKGELSISC